MTQESQAISEPPPETKLFIESTLRGVGRRGLAFEKKIRSIICGMPWPSPSPCPLSFLVSSDPYHAFYLEKRNEYIDQLLDGTVEPPPESVYKPPPVEDFEPPPTRDHPQHIREFPIPPEMSLVELGVIKLTALFVARYGIVFWKNFVRGVCLDPLFTFMKRKDSKFSFYNGLVLAYQRVLRPNDCPADIVLVLHDFLHCLELDEIAIYLHAFVAGLDCFTHMDDHAGLLFASMPPPQQPLSLTTDMPPLSQRRAPKYQYQQGTQPPSRIQTRITLKQLGVMKLTALFVARYGEHFRRELMLRAVTLPHFEFLFFHPHDKPCTTPPEISFQVFSILVRAYSSVLTPCKKSRKKIDASVLECFFHRLQIEKLGEASDESETAAVMDLHAFVACVDYVAHMDLTEYSDYVPPPERLTVMMNQPTHMHPGVLVQFPRTLLATYYYSCPSFSRGLLPLAASASAFTIPPQEELLIVKLTAQFATRFGASFRHALMKRVPQLESLKVIDRWGSFFYGLCEVYSGVLMPPSIAEKKCDDSIAVALEAFLHCLRNGVETSVVAFVNGVDYFASVDDADYSTVLPPPERLSVTMNRARRMHTGEPEPTLRRRLWSYPSAYTSLVTVTPKEEIVVIKLTALFVARYGVHICRDLMKKAGMNFMEPADTRRFSLYKAAVDAYSKVVRVFDGVATETVVERYLWHLKRKKPKPGEEGVMDMDDLYGFVEGVDCFAQMEDASYSALVGNPLTKMPGMYSCPPEEPEPKRQKLDQSFAQVSSKIRVFIPVLNGRKVIEITGDRLSEKVASLKEKIAGVIHMPVNKLKLRGKAGFLKDDRSLAQNDVGPGEILTLSWFISRWS